MSDLRLGQGPYFERGIDSIVDQQRSATATLPQQAKLLPPGQAIGGTVERVLTPRPTLEALIDDAIQPHIDDPELLLPHRFSAHFRAAVAEIRGRADAVDGSRSDDARKLQRGRRLCDELEQLDLLKQVYLSALYAG